MWNSPCRRKLLLSVFLLHAAFLPAFGAPPGAPAGDRCRDTLLDMGGRSADEEALRRVLRSTPRTPSELSQQRMALLVFRDWLLDQGREEEAEDLLATHQDDAGQIRRLVRDDAGLTVEAGTSRVVVPVPISFPTHPLVALLEPRTAPFFQDSARARFVLSELRSRGVAQLHIQLLPTDAAMHECVRKSWARIPLPPDAAALALHRDRVLECLRCDPVLAGTVFHPSLRRHFRLGRIGEGHWSGPTTISSLVFRISPAGFTREELAMKPDLEVSDEANVRHRVPFSE